MSSIDDKESIKRLRSLSECCICLDTYTDPRQLPCLHTACLGCLENKRSKNDKKPGDVLPCPLCRKEFSIPQDGMTGLQRNFFIENLIEVTRVINLENKRLSCVMCGINEEAGEVSEATVRCLNCCENFCLCCSKVHKSLKATEDHKIIEIERNWDDEVIRNMFPIRKCKTHLNKVLDCYCSDCKTVVCVSCFVEDHRTHKCKDVTTIDRDFRQKLEETSISMHDYRDGILSKKLDMEKQKKAFLQKTLETEKAIAMKNLELKNLIDRQTHEVLEELALLKQKQEREMDTELEEIGRKLTVLESFVTYCIELKSKGSPSEICSCADNLIIKAEELNEENKEYLSAPRKSVDIKFIPLDKNELLQNVDNMMGKVAESSREAQCAVVIGRYDFSCLSEVVMLVNLNRSEDVSLQQIPTEMQWASAAAVYANSVYVTGAGSWSNEIWRFDGTFLKWKKCASMARGRQRLSAAFVEHVLYVCGGYAKVPCERILDDVEAYDTCEDKCSRVGQLFSPVAARNCISFKASLYFFGGMDSNGDFVSSVQVYDTKLDACTLLSNPMPRAYDDYLSGVLWENSVILLGKDACLTYSFETETFNVRDRFKPDAFDYGLIINDDKLYVIGGFDARSCTRRDDVRWIPVMNILNDEPIEWKRHAKLPKPLDVFAAGNSGVECQWLVWL